MLIENMDDFDAHCIVDAQILAKTRSDELYDEGEFEVSSAWNELAWLHDEPSEPTFDLTLNDARISGREDLAGAISILAKTIDEEDIVRRARALMHCLQNYNNPW